MKKENRKLILGIIIGLICATAIGVSATTILATSVSYNPNPKSQTGAQTVSEALDELYTMAGVKYSQGPASENTKYNSIDELKAALGSKYHGVFIKSNLSWSAKDNDYNGLVNQQVCLEKNDVVECFKPEYTEANKNKMANFFNEGICTVYNEEELNEYYECISESSVCSIDKNDRVTCGIVNIADCSLGKNGDCKCIDRTEK